MPRRCFSGWSRPSHAETAHAALAKGERTTPSPYRAVCQGAEALFRRIDAPARGDWLDEHSERGQSFVSFSRLSMALKPHGHVRVIELVPIGPFDALGTGRVSALDTLCRYVSAFFCLPCRVTPGIALRNKIVGRNARRGDEGQVQLDVADLVAALRARRQPRDVLCRVAVTMADLYIVKDGVPWNFVFGQAHKMDGLGAFSLSRYHPRGHPVRWPSASACKARPSTSPRGVPSEQLLPRAMVEQLSEQELRQLLQRGAKVLTHELGHLFGISHCVHYECLMCGCNHMQEFDKRPMFLCPIDLRKLHSAIGFDIDTRYAQLEALYCELGWVEGSTWLRSRRAELEAATAKTAD